MLKKFFKQKGQALVFFAIALPTLFMFVAVVVEFGWWYINQSRLQNAADAAVLAGAEKIVSSVENKASNISFKVDFVNKVPPGYSASQAETAGDETAKQYADKNFYYSATEPDYAAYYNSFKHYTYGDTKKFNPAYYAVELEGKAKHLFSIMNNFGEMNLKAIAVARITENIESILNGLKVNNVMIGNWEVQNVYQNINDYYKNKDGTPQLNDDGSIKYKNSDKRKEFQNASGYETLFTGRWNHYKEPNKKIYYTQNNEFRTEVVDVYVTRDLSGNTTYKTTEKIDGVETEVTKILDYGSAFPTPANGGQRYSWRDVESINLDWAQDFQFNLKNSGAKYSVNDWDIGYALPDDVNTVSTMGTQGWNINQLNYRIHGLITFYEVFPTIAKKLNEEGEVDEENGKYYYDPLWVRIESEPMWSYLGANKQQLQLDTVHQIIININESNWMEEEIETQIERIEGEDNKEKTVIHPIPIDSTDPRLKNFTLNEGEKVILRPLVFFYDGPETNATNIFLDQANITSYNGQTRPATRPACRNSKPVILNLNADFAGILYMPNSPVCVITNGHKFRGFIRAKSYKMLQTADELTGETITQTYSHTTKNRKGETLESPTLHMKTVVYNPSGTQKYDKEVHGEVYFKDVDKVTLENSLPAGSEYSIFNIAELKDTFFDAPNPYTLSEEHGTIIMTSGD